MEPSSNWKNISKRKGKTRVKKMEYKELKQLIALNTGKSEEDIEMIIQEFNRLVISNLASGEKVKVAGLGTFTLYPVGDGKVKKLLPRLVFFFFCL